MRKFSLILCGLILMGFTYESPSINSYYTDYGGKVKCASGLCPHKPPTRNTVYVCHGSGCEWTVKYTFDNSDLNHLKHIFSNTNDVNSERRKITRAIAWMEKRVCKTAGTCEDKAGANWLTSKSRGQMECVDETTNTTSYLLVMKPFLKYCKPSKPIHRYGFGTFPHWAGRINCTDGVFVVDSYFKPNGGSPAIVKIKDWIK